MDFAVVGTTEGAAWDDWELRNLTTDAAEALTLGSHGTNAGSAELPAVAAAGLTVRAFDTDDCGVLYLLTADGDLYRYHHDRDALALLHCVADADPEGLYEPIDLAVTRDDIVVGERLADPAGAPGDAAQGRLHALSRHLLQTRWLATDDVGRPVRLFDDDRRVFLVTERTVPDADPPIEGVVTRLVRGGVGPTVRGGLAAPRDAALVGDDRIVVLTDAGPVAFEADGDDLPDWQPPPLDLPADASPPTCLTGDGDGLVFGLADAGETLVRVTPAFLDAASDGGSGASPGEAGDGTPGRTVKRVPGVRHPCARLLARRRGPEGLYVLDTEGRLRFSAAVDRFTADLATGEYVGTARRWFDSGERGMAWHRTRLSLSADDPGTAVTVDYCATDDPPSAVDPADHDWRTTLSSTDALLDDAEGRYLGVTVELVGTDATSPSVSAVQAYLPRSSYLRYLPAIYDTETDERTFLERYLSVFESVFVDVESGIEALPAFLGSEGIPAEFVGWLGSWLASETDSAWPTAARREFLARAPELYRLRGTPAGLVETVRIYLRHAETDVPDWFRERPGAAVTTDGGPSASGGAGGGVTGETGEEELTTGEGPTASADPTAEGDLPVFLWEYTSFDCIDDPAVLCDWRRLVECPQCFLLLVPPGVGSEAMAAVDRIVAWATPAHAVGRAVELRPWARLGANGYLGVNSYLGDRAFVVEDALLGADSVLGGREPDGQLGLAGRLGREARLS